MKKSRLFFQVRALMFTVLAFMLVAMGSAQIRATVISAQAESGMARVYETEVHHHRHDVTVHRTLRMGRKPYDHVEHRAAGPSCRSAQPIGRAHDGPAAARASPHAPRAPPVVA